MPLFEVESFQNGIPIVHNDVPGKVVGHNVTSGPRVERLRRFSPQVDGKLLKNLSADDPRPRRPQFLHEGPGYLVLLAR